jgi:hypothetical protein
MPPVSTMRTFGIGRLTNAMNALEVVAERDDPLLAALRAFGPDDRDTVVRVDVADAQVAGFFGADAEVDERADAEALHPRERQLLGGLHELRLLGEVKMS